ncbi:fumarylacetoacetate hydrolase family protein [Geminocystis sp. NIES-3708]|uniref:fumarylacetoacetate hydrolase family protein n=1 Tax=Geminocystis sp. NIES-3708 TaxID=1615909 RepID=UPI00082F5663|nr:fumarylacetoacetate hydrolase family protein [Geminocystis sp. NIES-3708]
MAQRYVRVKTTTGHIYYGKLQLNRTVEVLDAPPWLNGKVTDQVLSESDYHLLAPCAPSKIVAVGKNYADHAAEMGSEVPKEPLIFLKPSSAVIAHLQNIVYPQQSQRVDFEGELALVIGDRTKNCTVEEAKSKIWGYTIANDVTARDLQKKDGQWTRAKGFDTFCPLGPWIVRELTSGARLTTIVNEEQPPKQSTLLSNMVFSPEKLVAYISQIMTLLPGDVILTGTPEGIAPLTVGDTVSIEIESIGTLTNQIEANHGI